jgi:hypothetical protein
MRVNLHFTWSRRGSNPLSSGRNKALDVVDLLMPSTPSASPQVVSRRLVSFRVINSTVIPAQVDFWAWFDSRQLHRESAGQGHKTATYRDYVKIVPLVEVRPERLGGPELRERHRPLVEGSTAYPLRTQEWLGPGTGGGSDDGHSSVPDVWH